MYGKRFPLAGLSLWGEIDRESDNKLSFGVAHSYTQNSVAHSYTQNSVAHSYPKQCRPFLPKTVSPIPTQNSVAHSFTLNSFVHSYPKQCRPFLPKTVSSIPIPKTVLPLQKVFMETSSCQVHAFVDSHVVQAFGTCNLLYKLSVPETYCTSFRYL